ncbi:hypothetical protein [Paludibaculum fermentans]|uniref:Uncharacterized protein n=1 Tax=Paludibaculum fermentans TaxID=1473598 RepID=A0A7S7NXL5_PALFE|nr:hypothetical protein [Paludibaculum fermentans]QOY91663.1 hypothetical protein IRI77_17475 [Paludibaculum fermentans]
MFPNKAYPGFGAILIFWFTFSEIGTGCRFTAAGTSGAPARSSSEISIDDRIWILNKMEFERGGLTSEGRMETGRRPAEDLWRRTLSQLPTIYGRLVYLSTLRNSDSGRYEHHGLSVLFGEDQADQAMRESHLASFREWLKLNLEQQKADLDLYLCGLPTDRRTLVESWSRLAPYRNLSPAAASDPERMLFLEDLEILLETLRNEYASAARRPDDSRRQ